MPLARADSRTQVRLNIGDSASGYRFADATVDDAVDRTVDDLYPLIRVSNYTFYRTKGAVINVNHATPPPTTLVLPGACAELIRIEFDLIFTRYWQYGLNVKLYRAEDGTVNDLHATPYYQRVPDHTADPIDVPSGWGTAVVLGATAKLYVMMQRNPADWLTRQAAVLQPLIGASKTPKQETQAGGGT